MNSIERENRGENHKSQKSSVRNRGMVRVKNAKVENTRAQGRDGTGEKRKSQRTPVRRGEMVRVKNTKGENHSYEGEK